MRIPKEFMMMPLGGCRLLAIGPIQPPCAIPLPRVACLLGVRQAHLLGCARLEVRLCLQSLTGRRFSAALQQRAPLSMPPFASLPHLASAVPRPGMVSHPASEDSRALFAWVLGPDASRLASVAVVSRFGPAV